MNLPLDAQARIENAQRLMNGALGGFGGIVLCGFGVAAFCFVTGSRLALNRPNARGSLLSPTAWIVLGTVIAAPVIAASLLNPAAVKPAPAVVWLAALAFAGACFWRAFAITHADAASAAVRWLSRFAPWAGVPMGISLASLAGGQHPRVQSPKWMSYLVWVGVALLLGSLAMWLAGN